MSEFIEARACITDEAARLLRELAKNLSKNDEKLNSAGAEQLYQSIKQAGIDPVDLAVSILRMAVRQEDVAICGTINLADLFVGDAPSSDGWESGQETFGLSLLDSQPSSDDSIDFEGGGLFSTARFVHKDEAKKQLFIASVSVGFVKT